MIGVGRHSYQVSVHTCGQAWKQVVRGHAEVTAAGLTLLRWTMPDVHMSWGYLQQALPIKIHRPLVLARPMVRLMG